jgi:hypothetical protein
VLVKISFKNKYLYNIFGRSANAATARRDIASGKILRVPHDATRALCINAAARGVAHCVENHDDFSWLRIFS